MSKTSRVLKQLNIQPIGNVGSDELVLPNHSGITVHPEMKAHTDNDDAHHTEAHNHTHASTTGQTANDHHNESHALNSHTQGSDKIFHTKGVEFKEISLGAAGTYLKSAGAGADMVFDTPPDTQLTNEEVMDIAGPLIATGGTKTGIAITYQDATDDMDFVVDHDTALNFTQTEHFTEASIDHTAIQNIGTNSHAQIDTHIGDSSDPHGAFLTQSNLSVTSMTTTGAHAGVPRLVQFSRELCELQHQTGSWVAWAALRIGEVTGGTNDTGLPMGRPGSIVGLSINYYNTNITGTGLVLKAEIIKNNGASVWDVTLNAGANRQTTTATQSRGTDTFAAGDLFKIHIVLDADDGGATIDVNHLTCCLEVYYNT